MVAAKVVDDAPYILLTFDVVILGTGAAKVVALIVTVPVFTAIHLFWFKRAAFGFSVCSYPCFDKSYSELAVAVSEKIIKKEVELNPEILQNVLEEVLEKVNSDEQKIKIKVSEDDFEYAKENLPKLVEKSGIQAKISIMQDENVQKGSCILIASNGVVDANFTTQLNIIKNAFSGAR